MTECSATSIHKCALFLIALIASMGTTSAGEPMLFRGSYDLQVDAIQNNPVLNRRDVFQLKVTGGGKFLDGAYSASFSAPRLVVYQSLNRKMIEESGVDTKKIPSLPPKLTLGKDAPVLKGLDSKMVELVLKDGAYTVKKDETEENRYIGSLAVLLCFLSSGKNRAVLGYHLKPGVPGRLRIGKRSVYFVPFEVRTEDQGGIVKKTIGSYLLNILDGKNEIMYSSLLLTSKGQNIHWIRMNRRTRDASHELTEGPKLERSLLSPTEGSTGLLKGLGIVQGDVLFKANKKSWHAWAREDSTEALAPSK